MFNNKYIAQQDFETIVEYIKILKRNINLGKIHICKIIQSENIRSIPFYIAFESDG